MDDGRSEALLARSARKRTPSARSPATSAVTTAHSSALTHPAPMADQERVEGRGSGLGGTPEGWSCSSMKGLPLHSWGTFGPGGPSLDQREGRIEHTPWLLRLGQPLLDELGHVDGVPA